MADQHHLSVYTAMRLDQWLVQSMGISRRDAKSWIQAGWVTINHQPVTKPGQRVSCGDTCCVQGVPDEDAGWQPTTTVSNDAIDAGPWHIPILYNDDTLMVTVQTK